MSSETSCSLGKWQDPNTGILNDVLQMGRRTYYSAFTFLFFKELYGMTDLSVILFKKITSCRFLLTQSETVFSKVTSDFLITRSKAVFYSLPLCHVTRIHLLLELFPCRFVCLHFWWHLLCSLLWEPRDSIFGLLFFYLCLFFVFPLNHIPFKLLCVCQRWHHSLNHSDLRV